MATRFLARPLQVLDRLYRFVEGQGPQLIENALPIQFVHDVGRQSELGQPGMGFFMAGQDNVHVGAGGMEASFDPYTEVGYLFPNVADIWVWIVQPWCTLSAAVLTSASLTIGYAPAGEYIVRRDRLVQFWDSYCGIYDQNVAPATFPYAALPGARSLGLPLRPALVTPGSTMRVQTTASGAGTIRVEAMFWAGPIGVTPPDFG